MHRVEKLILFESSCWTRDLAASMRSSEGCVVSAETMKEAGVLAVLREVEGGSKVSEVCKRHSISETTFYRWRARYAQVDRDGFVA